jgi:hypothetical protein
MNNNLTALSRYFLTGTAEGDRSLLSKVFIHNDQLADLIAIEPGAMRILVGNKGAGKTAILERLNAVTRERGLPTVLLRPDDLDTKAIGNLTDIGGLKRGFFDSLVNAIAIAIGRQLKGFLTGDAGILYVAAKEAGATDPDLVENLLKLISAIAVPAGKLNGVQLAKDLAGVSTADTLIRAIQRHLASKGAIFFVLVDDTDQVAAPTDPTHLNRIWALLLAVRRLIGESQSVRAIVSLRTEVLTPLKSENKGQRDQKHHLRELII